MHNNRSTLGSREGRTSPKSALCRPLCRTSLRLGLGETLGCEAPSFPDGKALGFSACVGLWAAFPPQVGKTTRSRPFRGDLGPTGPSLAERKETNHHPGLGRIRGCDSQAGERVWVGEPPTPGSPRPAEPVVPGFLPGPTARKIRGRLGGLWVTTGVRNTKIPGGKPFLRVSPPGSTKG